jgi:hypothetical protein
MNDSDKHMRLEMDILKRLEKKIDILIQKDKNVHKKLGESVIDEENEKDDDPPFEPTKKKSTPWTNPSAKAKQLARSKMKEMLAKYGNKRKSESEKNDKD